MSTAAASPNDAGHRSPADSPSASPLSSSLTIGAQGVANMPVIPPEHRFRTLVLCFDGTGDQFDADNSNIVELFSMLPKADRTRQMVYYQCVATPLWSKVNKMLDEAIACHLDTHVMGGYEFLMQNYTAGDRICLFGFSRGAYVARSLAGMLHKVGLLPACNHQQIPFAYKMYTTTDETGWKQSNAFKKAFSIDVDIEFIGVWDTVNSVGLIPKRLPFTTSNTIVRTFRHAISLDERRAKFKPNLWNRPNDKEQMLSVTDKQVHAHKHHDHDHALGHAAKKPSQRVMERQYSRDITQPTDVEEVWFAGCHCDVGGGSVDNNTASTLARIPLRWMVRECFKTNSGIMFHADGLRGIGLDPESLYPVVKPRPPALPVGDARIRIRDVPPSSERSDPADAGDELAVSAAAASPALFVHKTEEELDLADALAPLYDQLRLRWFWWLLELIPLRHRYQRGDNAWMSYVAWNMGRGRFIPKQQEKGVRVHRSVKTRLEAQTESGRAYKPKAAFDLGRTIWVD